MDLDVVPKTKIEKDKLDELRDEYGDKRKASYEYLRWKCKTDLFFLGYEILSLKDIRKEGRGLVDPVFHTWLCSLLQGKEDRMILIPRRHMKTTWVKVRVMQILLNDPGSRIALHSVTTNLVRKELRSLVRMFQNPMLVALFPDVIPPWRKIDRRGKPDSWMKYDQDNLTMKWPEGFSDPQENQIEVYGVESTVTGSHYDWHILDDILNEDTVRTAALLRKTEEFYEYLQGLSEPHTHEIIIGTPYHYSDLYSVLMNEKIYTRDQVVIRPCIENGRPIYKYFTLKDLERIKKKMSISQGPYVWSCQWMCNPIPREDQLFPPPQPTYSVMPEGDVDYYITVDPAATVKEYSDETAIVVTAINHLGWIYVVEAEGYKKGGEEISDLILALNEKYKPRAIGIELGLQTHLKTVLRMRKEHWEAAQHKQINLPVMEVKIDVKRSKYEKVNLTLGSWIRSGHVKIHHSLTNLMRQMERFTPNYQGKDDLVDALSMVFQINETFNWSHWRMEQGLVKKDWTTFEEIRKLGLRDKTKWKERFAV